MAQGPISDYGKLRTILQKAKNIVVLTGAGTSAESGIPTFRGAGGLWRTYQATDLATLTAFKRSPSLIWEFYHYRRELVLTKKPNKAHIAIADAEKAMKVEGRKLTVLTQNIDGLHQRAGSQNVIELHGSLFKTLCTVCNNVEPNVHSPICKALEGKGAPDLDADDSDIPVEQLPRCSSNNCGGLLRPYVVWFGENLHPDVLDQSDKVMDECDACLVVGTSSVVYPAAMFAPNLAAKGVPVAEFNMEKTPATDDFMFHFHGPCTDTVSEALKGIANTPIPLSYLSYASVSYLPFLPHSIPFLTRISRSTVGDSDRDNAINKHNPININKSEVGDKLSGAQKLKRAVAQYGTTVITFHIGMSLASLGAFYTAFSSGLDMDWLVNAVGLEGKVGSVATGASTFVIAYAVHKVFAPVRISITLAAAPFIVRYLRNIGFLKKPKPQTKNN